MAKFLYIFLDEGGNFDFSPNGTRYFTLTSVSLTRPFTFVSAFTELKYNLIEACHEFEYFHATTNKQEVRNQVFNIIAQQISGCKIDAIIVEKRKTNPMIREPKRLYPMMLRYLLQYVCYPPNLIGFQGIIIITDKIPINKQQKAIEKAIKTTLPIMISSTGKSYKILHYQAKSSFGLQIVDYVNWAIYRRWNSKDLRSYNLIKDKIRSEFDIFQQGDTIYY